MYHIYFRAIERDGSSNGQGVSGSFKTVTAAVKAANIDPRAMNA